MKTDKSVHIRRAPASVLAIGLIATLITTSLAKTSPPTPGSSPGDATLQQQMADLHAKMAKLEAAISSHSQQPGMSTMGGGMRMGGGMQAGGGMNMPSSQSSGGTGMMNMMGDMSMMDQMMGGTAAGGGMSMEGGMMMSMAPHSSLPGFPGASHIYHIGATGFFLDHAQHIGLSTAQQVNLNKIKEQTLLSRSATDRQIEQTEQELAILTSSDQPDLKKIENKIREIAKLEADERIAFIKAVGEAAKLLTDDQRKILTGFATPADSPMPAMSPMEHM